jgi:serine/threonine protein kinase
MGAYEITALLGKGGMGEVYRAHDARLGRDVALKVLPEVFASDPDRLARFEREARVLASLTHANIGAIFGLEEGVVDGRSMRALASPRSSSGCSRSSTPCVKMKAFRWSRRRFRRAEPLVASH